jgi:Flp pilus assembly protein TadG
MVEFAIIAPVFLLVLFLVFEVAYDQYLGVVLQATVQNLAHQIQIGDAAGETEASFLNNQYCANTNQTGTLLGCNNLFLRVQRFNPSKTCTDLYSATQGTLPVDASGLELGDYFNAAGGGQGAALGPPTTCTTNTGIAYCDAGANQTIILTGIYVSPSLIMGLIKGSAYSYNKALVVAQIASVGFQTENFSATVSGSPAC